MRNMWPLLLDSSEEECMKTLRRLELEAYGCLVSALRAQGGLTSEKLKILKDTASALHITPERHRAEIRRAVNDEQLCTIAQFAEGPDTYAEWSVEGRRKVRLVPRVVPQTAFLAVARRVADVAQADNAKMPWPAATARPPPIPKVQTTSAQIKYDHEDRIPKKRRRLSDDSLPSASQSSSLQASQSIVFATQSPGQQKHHRIQKHGISKIQQMYKNQSRLATSTLQRQQSSSSTAVSHQEIIMPPPRTTIKTIPPVKQNKTTEILEKNPQVTTSAAATAISTPITAKVIHQNKSLIKISTQNPTTHQKLVIVSASQPINSNIIHQTSSGGGGSTNKIITTPINTIKIKTTVGGTVATIAGGSGDDLELKCSKITNQQVIVSKSQLTPLQTIHHGHHTHVSVAGGDTKSKVLTVQAKVRPQGSIIVPLQSQTATSSGQFAGVSVPVLQGVQWKAIQGKSTVKLLPLSGNAKIIQKQGGTVGSAPIYVMSKPSNILVNKTNDAESTKTTLSNITHIRPLTQKSDDATSLGSTGGSGKLLVVRKATPIQTTTGSSPTGSSSIVNVVSSNEQSKSEDDVKEPTSSSDQQRKSTVLQDALRASGVTAVDDDIESQISQYTVIPKTKTWTSDTTTIIDHHSHNLALQSTTSAQSSSISTQSTLPIVSATKSIQNIQLQDTKFLTLEEAVAILGDNSETRAILSHLQVDSSNQTTAATDHGQLDPQTGIYSPTPTNNSSTSAISSSSIITSTSTVNVVSKQTNEQRLDIFNTALVSADIQLDTVGGDSGGDEIITTSNNIEEQNSSTDEFYTDDNVIIDTTQLCPTELMQTEDVVVTTTSDETTTSLTDKQLTDILTGDDTSDNNDTDDNTNR
ncbi:BRCA2-interacting transcriptional repressor EMSY [Chrysoperla carnea]|uniref:BRCA2-interacting transcriptional repressor EMSY n=1 Tax=Chrysoperla carnea TaxID=189513 RepID=UPI001D065E05|nr:BRCA2-interacting transcriptional repressor EMSY [Chrysoperla carnea]